MQSKFNLTAMLLRLLIIIAVLYLGYDTSWAQLTSEQHQNLVQAARQLSSQRIRYNQKWRPPNQRERWVMDCSNTTRYVYQTVFGKKIERTASSQYYELQLQRRITSAPKRSDGSVDTKRLLSQLRAGDLLFWEWTYNIKRRPPITHVMIYMGTNKDGQPRMFGSASGGRGERTRSGGVDIYPFDPNAPMGGVRSVSGRILRKGRFVGFGRHVLP